MGFWKEVVIGFIANVSAGVLLVLFYVAIQWFLQVTDIDVAYSWKFDGTIDAPNIFRPSFDIRNLSRSRTYVLANIAYLNGKRPIAAFDGKSVWGIELKPDAIVFVEAAPVQPISSFEFAKTIEVHVRLQGKRLFWLQGVGPGQQRKGLLQRSAFWLRDKLERMAFPLE